MIQDQPDQVKRWMLEQIYAAHENGIREALRAVRHYCLNNDPSTIVQEIDLALSDNPDKSRLR